MKNHSKYECAERGASNRSGGNLELKGTAQRYSRMAYTLGACTLSAAVFLCCTNTTIKGARRLTQPASVVGIETGQTLEFLKGHEYLGVSETEYLHMTELSEAGTILCGMDGLVTEVARVGESVLTGEGKAVENTVRCVNVTKTCTYTMVEQKDGGPALLKEVLQHCATVEPIETTSIPEKQTKDERR